MNRNSEHLPSVIDLSGNRDPHGFAKALAQTNKGDSIIYHTGEFAGGMHKQAALNAAAGMFVSLVQKPIGNSKSKNRMFQYIAQRTAKKWTE